LTAPLLAADLLSEGSSNLIATSKPQNSTLYVGEYFLTDRLSAWKVDFLMRQIDTCG
jgi:hypothetical protein